MDITPFGKVTRQDIRILIGIPIEDEACGHIQRGVDTSNIQIQKTGADEARLYAKLLARF
jgi:hypothetical protein